jgi:hypothetical protein
VNTPVVTAIAAVGLKASGGLALTYLKHRAGFPKFLPKNIFNLFLI